MPRWTRGAFVASLLAALLTLGAWSVAAQVPDNRNAKDVQTATASIAGVILSNDSGRPVALAHVTLRPNPQSNDSNLVERTTTTDASGHYDFRELRAGSYHLAASAPSYLFASYGQQHPGGRGALIDLAAGQGLKIDLRMAHGSAITGHILNQEAEPVVRVVVRAVRLPSAGETVETSAVDGETDDRGMYRLYGLAPGRYYVLADPAAGRGAAVVFGSTPSYAPTYYPGTLVQSEAQPVEVPLSQDLGGIDLVMQMSAGTGVARTVTSGLIRSEALIVRPMSMRISEGTASISGAIMSADSGRPLAFARVGLTQRNDTGAARSLGLVTTDPGGRFEFSELAPGSYYLSASAATYVTVNYGQRRPGGVGRPIEVSDGQLLKVEMRLPRCPAIAGRILSQEREPVARITVRALRLPSVLLGGTGLPVGIGETDDRGAYRLYGLAPGRYYVSAEAGTLVGDRMRTYAPTYYPGVFIQSEAQLVDLQPGQDFIGIDFVMPLATASTVSGLVITNDGSDPSEATVQLVGLEDAPGKQQAHEGPVRPDGTFVIPNVPPGQYLAFAESAGSVAHSPLLVAGRDVTGITLSLAPKGVLNGRVLFEGSSIPTSADLASVEVSLTPPRGQLALGTEIMDDPLKEDGTFAISDIGAGNRRVDVGIKQGRKWTVKSVVVNQQDVTDTYFDARRYSGGSLVVTLTDRSTELSGTAIGPGGKFGADTVVLAFPVDSHLWTPTTGRLTAARVDRNGTYHISGLPPGEYYLVASEELTMDSDTWDLERLRADAIRINLQDGDTKRQDLKVSGQTPVW